MKSGLQVLFLLIWSVAGLLLIILSVMFLSSGVLTSFSKMGGGFGGSMMNGPLDQDGKGGMMPYRDQGEFSPPGQQGGSGGDGQQLGPYTPPTGGLQQ